MTWPTAASLVCPARTKSTDPAFWYMNKLGDLCKKEMNKRSRKTDGVATGEKRALSSLTGLAVTILTKLDEAVAGLDTSAPSSFLPSPSFDRFTQESLFKD